MSHSPPAWSPFAYGFRPFFLLAGLYAAIAVAVWAWMFPGAPLAPAGVPPQFWHGHEMLFGFIAAAIAGFLLTAVPSWTGEPGISGTPLALLAGLWLLGRIAFLGAIPVPFAVLAAVELAFLPALMAAVAPALFRSAHRNRVLLVVLSGFWVADAAFVLGLARGDAALCAGALRGALDLVLLLITIIGGRIVPLFTANALNKAGAPVAIRPRPWLDRAVIAAMAAYLAADLLWPLGPSTAAIAALAGVLHLRRLSTWYGWRTLNNPIVWVLHAAYLWLPIGLLLKSGFVFSGGAWAAHWQHALGAGAAGTMIMAVMTRASLGHTGHELRVGAPITAAYVLLLLAVAVRVFGPAVAAGAYASTITLAAGLWVGSFGVFVGVYAPILLRPRVDGKPG